MATRRKQITTKHRKGFLSVFLPWARRFGLAVCTTIFILWLGAWLIITGAVSHAFNWAKMQVIDASANAGFKVEALLIEGRDHADPAFLMALLNVQTGDPLFSFNPSQAKELLEQTEWIKHATVQRRLPGTLYILLQERIPSALWEHKKETFLLDEEGSEIKTDHLERFADLITVSGKGAPEATPYLLTHLAAEPELMTIITRATRQGERRWDLQLKDSGITLKMPEDEQIGLALRKISDAQKEEAIFDTPSIESIDLRFEDKMVIRTKPGGVIDYKRWAQHKNKDQGI